MPICFAEEFVEQLIEIDCCEDLQETLAKASQRLGFDHFALTLEARTTARDEPDILLHDYPDEWAKVYINFDLAGQDPVRRACDRAFGGFTWDHIEHIIPMTRGDRQMLAVGRECGISNGFTIPRHLPGFARGTCSFAVRPDTPMPEHCLLIAEIVGALALASALRISGMVSKTVQPRLSDRQRECVLWTARGKTASETAIILGISVETVVQHLKMARERYEVHCRQSLILAALFDGMIGFGDVFKRQHLN